MKAGSQRLSKDLVTRACYFGALTMVVQLALPLAGFANFHIAGLVVLAAAITLGGHGAWIAAGLGLFPACFLQGELGYASRVLLIAGAAGIVSEHHRRIPVFLPVSLLWVLVLGPVAALVQPVHGTGPSWSSLIVQGFADTTLAILVGTLLLYPSIWVRFHSYPRQITLSDMLVHVAPLMASFAVWMVLGVLWLSSGSLPEFPSWSGIALAVFAVWIPAWIGFRGSDVLSQALDEFGAAGLLSSTRNHTFSGKASDFLRRKTLIDIERVDVSARTFSREVTGEGRASTFTPDKGILAVSKQGTILFVNRLFRDLTELRTNDSIGKHLDQVQMDKGLLTHIEQVMLRTFERGHCTRECRVNELPNKLRFFEIEGSRADTLEDSAIVEGPDSAIITLRDITDRRTVETRLLQAQKVDSLGALVTGIAHAFNNALTSISGQASVATAGKEEDRAKALDQILDTAKGAGTLVRQLLDFAEGGPALVTQHELGALISERLNLLREMVGEQHQITFTKSDMPFPIHADANLIMQAMTNLVMNSKEALASRSGEITISLEEERFESDVSDLHVGAEAGRYARLRVRDDGPGMLPEVLARAFDPLFTTRGTSGHAGLGLSIVFAIVRAHNGFLTAQSFPERGTTISLYFPLQAAQVEELPQERTTSVEERPSARPVLQEAHTADSREQILIVEDEHNLRELLALMLKTLGYRVTTCASGHEALERCKGQQFDLLLVDMVMPRLQGTDLIAQLRDNGSAARMLLMTGYGTRVDAARADTLLPKPFDMNTLERAIRDAMSSPKAPHTHPG